MSSIGTGVRRPRPRKQRRHSRLARHSHWDSGLTAAPLPASQYDLYTTSYSPDGRVFQVEYANKAVESSGLVPAPHPIQLSWHGSFSPRLSSSCTFGGAMPVSKHQLGRRSSRNIRGICRAPLRCISSAECLGRGALLASSLMDSQEFFKTIASLFSWRLVGWGAHTCEMGARPKEKIRGLALDPRCELQCLSFSPLTLPPVLPLSVLFFPSPSTSTQHGSRSKVQGWACAWLRETRLVQDALRGYVP